MASNISFYVYRHSSLLPWLGIVTSSSVVCNFYKMTSIYFILTSATIGCRRVVLCNLIKIHIVKDRLMFRLVLFLLRYCINISQTGIIEIMKYPLQRDFNANIDERETALPKQFDISGKILDKNTVRKGKRNE